MVGHTSLSSAQSSHIAPVMLLSSIVTATGVVTFFTFNVCSSVFMRMIYFCWSVCGRAHFLLPFKNMPASFSSPFASPYEYYGEEGEEYETGENGYNSDFHGEFVIEDNISPRKKKKKVGAKKIKMEEIEASSETCNANNDQIDDQTDDDDYGDDDENESDMDHYAYESSGLVDSFSSSSAILADNNHPKQVLSGDILTVTMVWTNVYGLGLAFFLLMPIITMASTLAMYNFIVGLQAVTMFEIVQERRDPQYRFKQWRAGRIGARIRNGLHMAAFILSNVVFVLMGVHVASIQINKIGKIKVEDVFFGIIGPLLAPILLKKVRRPHTTILGTMELAMPFSAFLSLTFMVSVLAMGMKPYDIKEQLSRNMVASTVILPVFFGGVIMYVLHCVLRRRMLYVLVTMTLVFVGRQFTFNNKQPLVSASFILACISFFIILVTSSKYTMKWLSKT